MLSSRRVQKLSRLNAINIWLAEIFTWWTFINVGVTIGVKLEKTFKDQFQCDLITNMYTWSENSCGVSAMASYRSVFFSFLFFSLPALFVREPDRMLNFECAEKIHQVTQC